MGRSKIKFAAIIVGYSVIMTAFVILGVLYLRATSYQSMEKTQERSAYLLSDQNLVDAYLTGGITFDEKNIVSSSAIGTAYADRAFQELPSFLLLFCILTLLATSILIMALGHIQKKEVAEVVERLRSFGDRKGLEPSSFLTDAYQSIGDMFDSHIQDYKRLNSYLSHEQKNAIAILRAKLELTKDHESIHFLDQIADNIDDILTLSENLGEENQEIVDVSLVCATVCDDYQKLSDNIKFTFNEDANTSILAKERWIYRAISNLLDNAVKYSQDGQIELNVNNEHHSVIVTVKDQGIGIHPNELHKIFENHYRVNKLKGDGYGIGLSLVSHVCDLCGGFCWVESKYQEGSTFILSFPEALTFT